MRAIMNKYGVMSVYVLSLVMSLSSPAMCGWGAADNMTKHKERPQCLRVEAGTSLHETI